MVDTLLTLGAAQGLFLTVLLATRQVNSAANKVLAVAMLLFSVYIAQGVYYSRGYFLDYPHFIGISQPLIFVFGPILYVYTGMVIDGGHRFKPQYLVHFIPFVLVTMTLVPFYLSDGATKIEFLDALFADGPPLHLAIIENLQYIHGLTYVAATAVVLRRHRRDLRDVHSSVEHISLLWLRNLTIAIVAVWALATVLHLVELGGIDLGGLQRTLTPLAVSVFVYAVGYFGWQQPEIFRPVLKADESQQPEETAAGYARSGVSSGEAADYMRRLRELMETEQPWRDGQLTLPDLAERLALTPHNLSEVINSQSGSNFYDLVNGYRVEEAKRLLRDPEYRNLTVLAIAEESGFNSKSTFNSYFKKRVGETPSNFRKAGSS